MTDFLREAYASMKLPLRGRTFYFYAGISRARRSEVDGYRKTTVVRSAFLRNLTGWRDFLHPAFSFFPSPALYIYGTDVMKPISPM